MPIHQQVTIDAAPQAVYDLLLDSGQFTEMTGGRAADISTEEGGAASMFGGDIKARNVELKRGERVVQAWRSENWPEGQYSIVRFELKPADGKTTLVFDQTGYPEDDEEMLTGGWHQMYRQPMNKVLAGEKV